MGKVIFSLVICLFLFVEHSEGSRPTTVSLWQSDQLVVQGILPVEWSPLSSEELDALISTTPESVTQQSGKIVAGFQCVLGEKRDNFSQNPHIIIFAKTDEHVNQDMIQKTYAWLKKNNDLLAGMVPDRVNKMSIQNIEYKQELPAILFQNSLSVGDNVFTGLSAIVFLKKSYLNIVCLAEENTFAGYETVFRSFIESVSIPPALQHDTVIESQSNTFMSSEISAWVRRQWQPLLGVFLILGVYARVFRPGKDERV